MEKKILITMSKSKSKQGLFEIWRMCAKGYYTFKEYIKPEDLQMVLDKYKDYTIINK